VASPGESLLRDLFGAFGDISWAAYVPDDGSLDAAVEVLAFASDTELVTHRLLLSGYGHERSDREGEYWLSPGGARLRVIYAEDAWVRPALGAASRNRDRQGVPRLPGYFVALERRLRLGADSPELALLLDGMDGAERAEFDDLVSRYGG
jgi:hypothetical protein